MMFLFLVLFTLALSAASALGLTADSRDSADWAPTADGFRLPRDHRDPAAPRRRSGSRRSLRPSRR
jgi:hypothetical protein